MRFRFPRVTATLRSSTEVATVLPVPTADGLPAVVGFSANARVHPRGASCTWRVEYGPTTSYGTSTSERALPGKLSAHYVEDFAAGTNGWLAGIGRAQLAYAATGGPTNGPRVRYTDDLGAGDDTNHIDGIGIVHLGAYFYCGNYAPGDVPRALLGGGNPDLRGATMSMYMRGVSWVSNGTRVASWVQAERDPSIVTLPPDDIRRPNWAWTGADHTSRLASGNWELVEWTMRNRTQDWTFGGCNDGRMVYDYGELESLLSKVCTDFFPVMILDVNQSAEPTGAIDYAQYHLTYRNHSVCATSNGGTLVSSPAGGTGASLLTDGYRNGVGHEWESAATPVGNHDFKYSFAAPITLFAITVHNSTAYPSNGVEFAVSTDDVTYTTLLTTTLPQTHASGPNFVFAHHEAYTFPGGVATWSPIHPTPVSFLRVRVTSGYQATRWGLGAIEAFGTGAVEQTENDWHDVNRDVVVAPGTYHYRVVATTPTRVAYGPNQTIVVPTPRATVTPTLVSPATGPAAGGTTVTFTVADTTTMIGIRIAGTPTYLTNGITIVNATQVSGVTFAHAVGAVNLEAVNESGPGAPLANGFTFT